MPPLLGNALLSSTGRTVQTEPAGLAMPLLGLLAFSDTLALPMPCCDLHGLRERRG